MSKFDGFTRSWKVGSRTVTLTAPKPSSGTEAQCECVWDPDMPAELTEDETREYLTGLRAMVAEIAAELKLTVVAYNNEPTRPTSH